MAGFSHVDCSVAFFSQVAALVRPDHHVLDYGAGRGEHLSDDPVPYRRDLATLKGRAAHVAGCDVDPIITQNPFLDQADVIDPNQRLPYADASFDVIVSRYVFEHIDNPAIVSSELMRVLKPGGWLCVMTPNKWGYVAIAASVIPNKMHARMLSNVQPGRKAEDVFPTRYLLNTKRAVERYFGDKADISMFYTSAEPAYYFGSESGVPRVQVVARAASPEAAHVPLRLHAEAANLTINYQSNRLTIVPGARSSISSTGSGVRSR